MLQNHSKCYALTVEPRHEAAELLEKHKTKSGCFGNSMENYIDLSRTFTPVKFLLDSSETNDGEIQNWILRGRGQQLTWGQLLERRRVVILAEAESGKTCELRERAKQLTESGTFAFFVPIERLVGDPLEQILSSAQEERFKEWKVSNDEAYFFLDAMDEAKATQSSFSAAVTKLERALRGQLKNVRIFFSSRPHRRDCFSDGSIITELLKPSLAAPERPANDKSVEDPFVSKIFGPEQKANMPTQATKEYGFEVSYVRLSPLDEAQQHKFVFESGGTQIDEFFQELRQFGIKFFAERPGDLRMLFQHWQRHGTFDCKSKMCQKAIEEKLAEKDDSVLLSDQRAMDGAMEIAAALTFAKSYSFVSADFNQLNNEGNQILDMRSVLTSFSTEEQASLLGRGIFIPHGYGGLKFHHRQTQEFLCARWLHKLIEKFGCKKRTITELFFKEIEGVTVVVPALKPVAAWLSLWHPFFHDKVLEVDPFVLLTQGDPSSLPVNTRQKILERYAAAREKGELASDDSRNRPIYQFAVPELAASIKKVWASHHDDSLRVDLLLMIQRGKILQCTDIAETVAFDKSNRASIRGLAVEALVACGAEAILKQLSSQLLQEACGLGVDEFLWIAKSLPPQYISISNICDSLERTKERDANELTSLEIALEEIVSNCPEQYLSALANRVTELFLATPHENDYSQVSQKHGYLSDVVPMLARRLIAVTDVELTNDSVTNILTAVERCEVRKEDWKVLKALVEGNQKLKIKLFWRDVELARAKDGEPDVVSFGQAMPEHPLWFFDERDLELLKRELVSGKTRNDRQIVLSAIRQTVRSIEGKKLSEFGIEEIIADNPELIDLWAKYQRPIEKSEQEKRRIGKRIAREAKEEQLLQEDMQSWLDLKNELVGNPELLLEGENQFRHLKTLKRWLELSTKTRCRKLDDPKKLLEEATCTAVANNFVEGMRRYWRGVDSTKRTTGVELAVTAIYLDNKYTHNWVGNLTTEETVKATEIAIVDGIDFPDWLGTIFENRFKDVQSTVSIQIGHEWECDSPGQFLLYRFADQRFPISKAATSKVVTTICRRKPKAIDRLRSAIKILLRTKLSDAQKTKISAYALKSFESSESAFRINFLAILMVVDEDIGIEQLEKWLGSLPDSDAVELAERFFGGYFEWHSGSVLKDILPRVKASSIERLVHIAFTYIRPKDDIPFKSAPSTRRSSAQSSRSLFVKALANPVDQERLLALKRVAKHTEYQAGYPWIRMIERQATESMADFSPWTIEAFRQFRHNQLQEVRTAKQLYTLVRNILDDIRYDFENADSSSKRLLGALGRKVQSQSGHKEEIRADEASVQEWLAEQLALRSRGLFTISREPQVERNKRPDLTVSIPTCEIAIEVKQADSWTVAQLKEAVSIQLAGQYLKAQQRKYGILFASNHRNRKWTPSLSGKQISFQMLLPLLEAEAEKVNHSYSGELEVCVFGLSTVSENKRLSQSAKPRRKK